MKAGTYLNGVYGFGDMGKERSEYTSQAVVENFKGDGTKKIFGVSWLPLAKVASVKVADVIKAEGTDYTVDLQKGEITFVTAPAADAEVRIAYAYNNEYIPANEIPKIKPVMRRLNLTAKTRRIAVEYSNLAQFQA